jgi:hypothetical protein
MSDEKQNNKEELSAEEVRKRNESIVEVIVNSIYANTEGGTITLPVSFNIYEVEAIGEILHVYVKSSQETIERFVRDRGYSDITEVPEDDFPSGMLRTLTLVASAATASHKINQLHSELVAQIKEAKDEKKEAE